jgi:hypothetical protein
MRRHNTRPRFGKIVPAILVGIILSVGGCGGFIASRSAMTPASVKVSGYTRRDGSYVRPYSRRPPGSRAKDWPYELGACFSTLVFLVGVGITVVGFKETDARRSGSV